MIGRDEFLQYDRLNFSKDNRAGKAAEDWIPLPGYGVLMLILTTSGTSRHQSRTTLKRSRSHDGSAMMLTATLMSSERAILECLEIFGERDALAITLQPFFDDRFEPEEHGIQAERFQSWKTSCCARSTSPRVSR